jgi:hypothetical protein
MHRIHWIILLIVAISVLTIAQDTSTPGASLVVVTDFVTPADITDDYADALRMKLHRLDAWDTLDAISTRDVSPDPLGATTDAQTLEAIADTTDADMVIAGTLARNNGAMTLEVVVLDAATHELTHKQFTDESPRAKAIIVKALIEDLTGAPLPTAATDPEPEPELTDPINTDGDFESEAPPWVGLDAVSAIIQDDEQPGRGNVLVVRTDLDRDAWIQYQRDLMTGDASTDAPPELSISAGAEALGAFEGVHVRSDWIEATPGARYWLTADMRGPVKGNARIFVKGFTDIDTPAGLTEQSLIDRDMTPDDLSAMDPDERAQLLADDLAKHPERYRKEVYRWYLRCESTSDAWEHFASSFPPRGGLPDNVQFLRIDIFSAWPVGEYRFDNVHLYLAPEDSDPADE